uniref:Uncharacterized protein n=2 Tax=Cyclophora tenuis TaxID=216820 RepID=A0A7S1D5C5_CYCTE
MASSERSDKLCRRLRSNDPNLSVLRSYEIEDYDGTTLVQLVDAARHSQHLKWMYVDLDYMKMNAWEALAAFVNVSRSIEKLWVWNLRSQIPSRTEYISQFFSAMNPRAVSLQGFGIEMREPDRPFMGLERACVENFFARNDTITIVNILCEVRDKRKTKRIPAGPTNTHNLGSSFLDCALAGLQRNDTVQYLILRHSDQGEDCRMQINPTCIREFFRYNQTVETFSYLVGDSAEDAEILGTSLQFNRKSREICLHNMSEDASISFFAQLPGACKLDTLTLRDCAFATDVGLNVLAKGVGECDCLKRLDLELIPQDQEGDLLDDLLSRLCPFLVEHPSLRSLKMGNGRRLGMSGAHAIGDCISFDAPIKEVDLQVEELTIAGAHALAGKIPFFEKLRTFRLKCTFMHRESRHILMDALEQNEHLKKWKVDCTKVL